MFRKCFRDEYRKEVENTINQLADLLAACQENQWGITEEVYKQIADCALYTAKFGNMSQKTIFCRYLYEARIDSESYSACSHYLKLEVYFRKLCQPVFNEEASFKDVPLREISNRSSAKNSMLKS